MALVRVQSVCTASNRVVKRVQRLADTLGINPTRLNSTVESVGRMLLMTHVMMLWEYGCNSPMHDTLADSLQKVKFPYRASWVYLLDTAWALGNVELELGTVIPSYSFDVSHLSF